MICKGIIKGCIALLFLFSYSFQAFSSVPTFDSLPIKLTAAEDSLFTFYVNATDTDGHYPLTFSDDSEVKLPVFEMLPLNLSPNNRMAIINFTPLEENVLDSTKNISKYRLTIIVKDFPDFYTTAQDVLINITNVDDAPNLTTFLPQTLEVAEEAQ